MKNFKFKSIKALAFFGAFVIIASICTIILLISSTLTRKAFKAQVEEDMNLTAKQVSQKLIKEIEYTEKLVEELATNPMLYNDTFTKEEIADFFEKRAKTTGFKLFSKIDKNGDGMNLTQKAETFNVADTEYFKRAINGETYISKFVDDIINGGKIIIISTPYYDYSTGEMLGVFVGIKGIDFISSMCSDFKWGQTGNIAVYDKDTNIVGHTNLSIVESGLNLIDKANSDPEYKSVAEFFQRHINTNTDGVATYDWFGKKRLGSIANIQDRDYVTLVAINEEEIYKNLNKLQIELIIVTIVLAFLGIMSIHLIFITKLTAVFKNLRKDLSYIADYDLTKKPTKDYSYRKDEIADIYKTTLLLKESITNIISNITSHAQNTAATAEQLTATSQSTLDSANEVSSAVTNIADGATSQAQDTQSAAESVTKSNENLENMLKILENLISSIKTINTKKDEGIRSIEELIQITNETKKSTGEVNSIIIGTSKSAEEISKASEMIQSISDQTNLLALNAAIEIAVGM